MKFFYSFCSLIIISILVISVFVLFSCSENNTIDNENNKKFDRNPKEQNNANVQRPKQEDMNKNREKMFENMILACENLTEGNACSIKTTRGKADGICEMEEETLLCKFEKPNYGEQKTE